MAGLAGLALAFGLLALNAYAAALIVARGRLFRIRVYRPMLLNLALSWVPLLVVVGFWIGIGLIVSSVGGGTWGPVLILTFTAVSMVVWTAFFPNSSYLITELDFSHRRAHDPVPLWFDIIGTLALTMAGIANSIVSLAAVQTTFVLLAYPNAATVTEPALAWALAGALLVLGTVGVYIGRFVRANSWDLVNPARLVGTLAAHLREPGNTRTAAGYVATYSLFLVVLYVPTFAILTSAVLGA